MQIKKKYKTNLVYFYNKLNFEDFENSTKSKWMLNIDIKLNGEVHAGPVQNWAEPDAIWCP